MCQIALIIAMFNVSWASIFITILLENDVPAVVIAFWRLFLSVAVLSPLLLQKDIRIHFKEHSKLSYQIFFFSSGFFLSLHFLSWIQSLKLLTVAVSVLVVNSSPIWVILISFLLFKEKINIYQSIGLIIGFIGLILISYYQSTLETQSVVPIGIALALFGAFMVAFYFIIGKRMRSQYIVPNVLYLLYVNTYCSVFLLVYSFILGANIFSFSHTDLILFLALAIGPSLLGHGLYTYAMKRLSAQTVSLAVIGESVGASLLAWILFSQILTPLMLLGGLLVLIGIFLNIRFDKPDSESPFN
jgi:drug/metabolite transporter (DMT)-like permease